MLCVCAPTSDRHFRFLCLAAFAMPSITFPLAAASTLWRFSSFSLSLSISLRVLGSTAEGACSSCRGRQSINECAPIKFEQILLSKQQ